MTEVRRSQERIAQLARFDPLTGLANRSLFRETLDELVDRSQSSNKPTALLFVDLDRFKAVNDCFGHATGDLLLRQDLLLLVAALDAGACASSSDSNRAGCFSDKIPKALATALNARERIIPACSSCCEAK